MPKNKLWDELFKDERLSGKPDKRLPKHLKLAIKHEQLVIKLRLSQIENYLTRIEWLMAGMDYDDTLKKLKPTYGKDFPKEEYDSLKKKYMEEQKNGK